MSHPVVDFESTLRFLFESYPCIEELSDPRGGWRPPTKSEVAIIIEVVHAAARRCGLEENVVV